ncbi:MAG: hypothetical protein ACC658_10270 [Acidimicrobiia bacterium]
MKKALVFVTTLVLVLIAGAAVAFLATPGDDTAAGNEAFEKPTTPDALDQEIEEPPATEEVKEEKQEEEPPKEEKRPEEDPTKEAEDTTPPDVVILFPEDGQRFDHREVAFEGKTEPNARVFSGDYEADVDEEGNWRVVLLLSKGGTTVTIKAIDEAGNKSADQVQVFYDAPKEEPKEEEKPKEEPKEHDFSASQKYGSSGEDVPYDKWYGTGAPGTEIWIGNDWGSASATIGDGGEWFLKVEFPGIPCGTHGVVLETNDGDEKAYEFTRVCDEGDGDKDK